MNFFNSHSLVGIIVFISCMLSSLLVVKSGKRKSLTLSWVFFSILVGIWGGGFGITCMSQSYSSALFWGRIHNLIAIFIPFSFVNFIYTFLKKEKSSQRFLITLFISTFTYFIFSIWNIKNFIPSVTQKLGFSFYIDAGHLYFIFPIFYMTVVSIGLFQCFIHLKKVDEEQKTALKIIFWGFVFGFSGGATTFPLVFNFPFYPYGTWGVVLYVIATGIVITKHNFLDIKVVITRLAALFTTASFVLLSFIPIFYLQENIYLTFVYVSGSTLFWARYFQKFRSFLQTKAETKWISDWYNATAALTEISKLLRHEKNRKEIFLTLSERLVKTVQTEESLTLIAHRENETITAFTVFGKHHEILETLPSTHQLIAFVKEHPRPTPLIQATDSLLSYLTTFFSSPLKNGIVLPFFSPEGLEGMIILGERSCELPYSTQDLDFFDQIDTLTSALLYRLTPYEKIEKQFLETQKKLHDAEMMTIQAKKNEDMAHMIQEYNHEIRTPLQAITTYAEYLPDTPQNLSFEKVQESRTMIIKNAERANDIIATTMRLSESMDVQKENMVVFDIHTLLENVLNLYPLRPELTIIKDFSSEPLLIKARYGDLFKVFNNLIKNADESIRHSGSIVLKTQSDDMECHIIVEDSGIGIPKNKLTEIWEPYKSRHVTKGRGLGLSIVHRIITEHQGRIRVVSTPGHGATFTVSLKKQEKSD